MVEGVNVNDTKSHSLVFVFFSILMFCAYGKFVIIIYIYI